jgi:hypothetical protein
MVTAAPLIAGTRYVSVFPKALPAAGLGSVASPASAQGGFAQVATTARLLLPSHTLDRVPCAVALLRREIPGVRAVSIAAQFIAAGEGGPDECRVLLALAVSKSEHGRFGPHASSADSGSMAGLVCI